MSKIKNILQNKDLYTWILIILIIVISLSIGFPALREGVYLSDSFYVKKGADHFENSAGQSIYLEDASTVRFHMKSDSTKDEIVHVEKSGNFYLLTYSDGEVKKVQFNGDWLCDEKGHPLFSAEISTTTAPNYSVSRVDYAFSAIAITEGNLETRSHLFFHVIGIAIYMLGVFMFRDPDKFAFLGKRWAFSNPVELSDEGLFMARIGAVLVCFFGIFLMAGGPLLIS